MIIDLKQFIFQSRPFWNELEELLTRMENAPGADMDLGAVKRFHYLYSRASSDLARLMSESAEPNMRRYLESVVARAYGIIHETRRRPHRIAPLAWFFGVFPRTFRKHLKAFYLSTAVMLLGALLGSFLLLADPQSKEVIMPFPHLLNDPSKRVQMEENAKADRIEGHKTYFSSYLMTHNTKVSIMTMALGMTFGVGTILMLFYNGVILGAVALDYMVAGESAFLFGWLLPHGAIEIPAILLAGQAGLVLAGALIGWGQGVPLRLRFRKISSDLVTLIGGVAVMLVWAGIIEAFFSQYHEPVIPYGIKIGFGVIELIILAFFLARSGANEPSERQSQPQEQTPGLALIRRVFQRGKRKAPFAVR